MGDLFGAEALATPSGVLTYGSVMCRAAIAARALRKFGRASVCTHHDAVDARVVTELQLYTNTAYVETRRLTDFDPSRNRWCTYGEARRVEIRDHREAVRVAEAMIAEMEQLPDRDQVGMTEVYHAYPDSLR